jgi:acylphosphatase
MTKARVHLFVNGRVQGVFYRKKTKQQAEKLGIMGWIRNLPDGRVEAVFEGEETAVKALEEYCHHGPLSAIVTNVDSIWEPYRGEFNDFMMY